MIDTSNPLIRCLVSRGFDLESHCYLRGGVLKTTLVATAKDGQRLQGWTRTGNVGDALRDLAKRAGIGPEGLDPDWG